MQPGAPLPISSPPGQAALEAVQRGETAILPAELAEGILGHGDQGDTRGAQQPASKPRVEHCAVAVLGEMG
jgi:hypothetical protein